MKYIYILIAVSLISVLTFCKGEKEATSDDLKNSLVNMRLSENLIFNEDSAMFANKVASDLQIIEGKKYFLRGMDLLVNKQKAQESIPLFRDAIRYYPDGRMYFFLAKAYIEINDAENALYANDLASKFDYEQFDDLYFNDALIYAIKKDTSKCYNNLAGAVGFGFLNKNKIVNEKRFDFMRDDPRFVALMVNTFNDDEKLKALLFKNYLKMLPDLNLPYAEPIDSVATHDFNKYIDYDYATFIPGMEDGRFARDVTNEYLFVGKMKLEENHFAVIYKSYLAIADTLNPIKTFVITYDSLGNTIDNEMIGCYCSPTSSQSYKVKEDRIIETTAYTYKWKNEPLEKGYAGNQIVSFEVDKPKQIQLIEKGIIKREGITLAETAKQ